MDRCLRLWVVAVFGAFAGCSEPENSSLSVGPPVTSEGLLACKDDGVDGVPHEGYRCHTYRGVAGISMGGGAALRIALERPELFDVVAALGAPYVDMEYFLLSVSGQSASGFCPREQLLANIEHLDDKDNPLTWCGPVVFNELALPDSRCEGFSGDYNHHYRGTPAGRGGSFDREGSFQIVQDFALAYGNPAFYNPASPYLPPRVPLSYHVPLELNTRERRAERDQKRAEICANPIRLTDFKDKKYNPTGEYPVITFCDGDGPVNGEYTPGVATFPVEVALAVDYNGNGRRDYAEPVISQGFEPYDDTGPDGLPSAAEPGYDANTNPDPSGDDYHWLKNPRGAERNFRKDPGEPFEDVGLDGVAGSGDYGEGTGAFEMNPNLEHTFARSPRKLVEAIDQRMLERLHIWADAGIRDFLYSPQITNQLWGALMTRVADSRLHLDWGGLAAATKISGEYDSAKADLSPASIGKNAYLRYGDPSICPDVDWENGRGNHVGPPWEVLNRLTTTFAFASARWAGGDLSAVGGGSLAELGGPAGDIGDFVQVKHFDSAALGRQQPYVVILPPDYYVAPEKRYPVIYFLHGQGQRATDLAASALLFLSPQMASNDVTRMRQRRSDWQKMLIVFADGECPATECHSGTFYIDFVGIDGKGPRHGEAFFELMREIDRGYRTKAPEMRPVE